MSDKLTAEFNARKFEAEFSWKTGADGCPVPPEIIAYCIKLTQAAYERGAAEARKKALDEAADYIQKQADILNEDIGDHLGFRPAYEYLVNRIRRLADSPAK